MSARSHQFRSVCLPPALAVLLFAAGAAPAQADPSSVTFYEHAHYKGKSMSLGEGNHDIDQLRIGNDLISSVTVPAGWRVVLFEHARFQGRSITLDADASFLDTFNDITSSIRIMRVPVGPPTVAAKRGRKCADEGGWCKFRGTADVYYGAGNKWVVERHTGSVQCSNGEFGDPVTGVAKACFVDGEAPATLTLSQLRNPSSTLCVDSFGREGAIIMHPCHGKRGNQEWIYTHDTGELRNPSSGLCLDSFGKRGSARAHACHGNKGNQAWVISSSGEVRNTSSGLCLDSFGRAGDAIMHPCHGNGGNQEFR